MAAPRTTDRPSLTAPDLTRIRMVVAPAFGVLLVLFLVVPALLRASGSTVHGQSERGGPGRTGVVADAAPAPPREVVWELATSTPLIAAAPLHAANDHATVVNGDRFEVLDLATGRVIRVTERASSRVPPELARPFGSLLLIPSGNQLGSTIEAVGLADGAVRWSNVAAGTSAAAAVAGALPLEDDLVLAAGPSQVRRLDLEDGTPVWLTDLGSTLGVGVQRLAGVNHDWTAAVTVSPPGAELRAGSEAVTSGVVVLDSRTGKLAWTQALTADEGLQPVTVSPAVDGRWLAHTDLSGPTPLVRVRSLATGEEVATISWTGQLLGLALIGDVVVVSSEAGLHGHRAEGGELLWTEPDPGAVVADGRIILARTGTSTQVRLLGEDGTVRQTIEDVHPDLEPTLVNGFLAITTADGSVAIRDSTGSALWSRPLTADDTASMVTNGDLVAVNGHGGTVVLDGRSGERITAVERSSGGVGSRLAATVAFVEDVVVASPLAPDGSGRALQALIAETGISRWNKDGEQPPVVGPLTRDGDTVFLPVGDQLHGYHVPTARRAFAERAGFNRGPLTLTADALIAPPTNGHCTGRATCEGALLVVARERSQPGLPREVLWSSDLPVCGPAAVRDARVLAPTTAGIAAFDLEDGTVLWAAEADGSCNPMAVTADLVVQAVGTSLRARDVATGNSAWTVEIGQTLATDPVIAGGEIVVGTADGDLIALQAATGDVAWQFRLPSPALADPLVVGDRWVVLLRDGRVVGLR